MKQRIFLLILTMSLLLTGCGTYVSVTPHREQRQTSQTDVATAVNYLELLSALKSSIAAGSEVTTITVAQYPPEVLDRDVRQSIMHAKNNDPIGSYAVEDIIYELGTRNGVPAVSLSIRYHHNRTEIQRIRKAVDVERAEVIISDVLKGYESSVVLLVEDYKTKDFAQFVQDYSEEHPQNVMETPLVSQRVYGTGKNRVVELIFTYQTSRDALRRMQSQVQPVFDAARLYVSGDGQERQKFSQLYAFLMERFDYKLETSITPSYSLLCYGVGDSRAFATVYAAMCRSAGLECMVVTGTRGGEPWVWNIIRDAGVYYHVDLLHEQENFLEFTDSEMNGYVWDYLAYPACTGQILEDTDWNGEQS